ncbi:Na(+)-translocating NADH-quinone reductase subunit C [Actinobacillus equuli]|nr:Na(+)-translocating NADH-quinone reductase subunit C [Actinobacillus equuli]
MAKFNKDSVGGTLTVVVLLSLICSLIVAGAAVLLKPTQDIQKVLDKQKNILQAAGLMQPNTNVQETYAKFIEPKIVDLATGDYVEGVTTLMRK